MTKYHLNGFTYSWEKGKHNISYPQETPKTFFKYYALNENSVDALTNLYIYASHPHQLNDLLDCHKDIVNVNDLESVKAILRFHFEECRQLFENEEKIFEYAKSMFKALYYTKIGIFSLTSTDNNEIMWALYAQNNGFCLEFDVQAFPFKTWGPYPINYIEKIPSLDSDKYGLQIPLLVQCFVKRSSWAHENEWRLLPHSPCGENMTYYNWGGKNFKFLKPLNFRDRKFKYPIRALKSVKLGPLFLNNCSWELVQGELDEYHVECKKDSLEFRVLRFLDCLQKQHDIKVYLSDANIKDKIYFVPIQIVQLNELNFRIIELSTQ